MVIQPQSLSLES